MVDISNIDFDDIPRTYEGYETIKELCRFGKEPADNKVVVSLGKIQYGRHHYSVVSNPIDMPIDLIALFCDQGNLYFGYRAFGNDICVFTD